jgi:hypothetical protein
VSKIEDLTLTTTLQDGNLLVTWNGGTRAIRAEDAATYFQGKIAGNFQTRNTMLTNLAQLGSAGVASQYIVITGVNTVAAVSGANLLTNLGFSVFGVSLGASANAAAARTTLGLGTLAVISSPLPVANGGTGETSAGAALTALGGQPLDATLTGLAGLTVTSGDYIEATGADTFRVLKLFITSISGTPSHAGQVAIVGGNAHMAIGTTGSGDWRLIDYRDTSIPVATAAAIADIADAENTTLKYAFKLIWDSTNKRMLRAAGGAAGDDWEVVDGSAQVTPV